VVNTDSEATEVGIFIHRRPESLFI
jgi:hypothetical protein